MPATKLKTRFSVGDTIEWIEPGTEQSKKAEVLLIQCQYVEPFGLWVMYGYGDKFRPDWVSENLILKYQKSLNNE